MPAVPSFIIETIWNQFSALRPATVDRDPLGCHRPGIPGRVFLNKPVQVLVFGCAYHRITHATCSATSLRRRRDAWINAGMMDALFVLVLDAYERMIGRALDDLSIDCCIPKAPCDDEVAGRSPVNRGKQGLKRSLAVAAAGAPQAALVHLRARRRVVSFPVVRCPIPR